MTRADRWTAEDVRAYYRQRGMTVPDLTEQDPHPNPLPEGEGGNNAEDHSSEAYLLEQVRALAKRAGWLCYHTHDSRRSEAGYPDVTLTDGTSVLFAELKSATGKLTDAQRLWMEMLRHTGAEVHVWRPADLGAIQARLVQAGDQPPSGVVRCWWCDISVPPQPHNQRPGLCTIHAALGCRTWCATCKQSWPEHGPGGLGCLRFVEPPEERPPC